MFPAINKTGLFSLSHHSVLTAFKPSLLARSCKLIIPNVSFRQLAEISCRPVTRVASGPLSWVQWLSSKSILPEQICSLYTTSASSLANSIFARVWLARLRTWPLAQLPISRMLPYALKKITYKNLTFGTRLEGIKNWMVERPGSSKTQG